MLSRALCLQPLTSEHPTVTKHSILALLRAVLCLRQVLGVGRREASPSCSVAQAGHCEQSPSCSGFQPTTTALVKADLGLNESTHCDCVTQDCWASSQEAGCAFLLVSARQAGVCDVRGIDSLLEAQ